MKTGMLAVRLEIAQPMHSRQPMDTVQNVCLAPPTLSQNTPRPLCASYRDTGPEDRGQGAELSSLARPTVAGCYGLKAPNTRIVRARDVCRSKLSVGAYCRSSGTIIGSVPDRSFS